MVRHEVTKHLKSAHGASSRCKAKVFHRYGNSMEGPLIISCEYLPFRLPSGVSCLLCHDRCIAIKATINEIDTRQQCFCQLHRRYLTTLNALGNATEAAIVNRLCDRTAQG